MGFAKGRCEAIRVFCSLQPDELIQWGFCPLGLAGTQSQWLRRSGVTFAGVAQLVRARGSYPRCPGFKSLHRHHFSVNPGAARGP